MKVFFFSFSFSYIYPNLGRVPAIFHRGSYPEAPGPSVFDFRSWFLPFFTAGIRNPGEPQNLEMCASPEGGINGGIGFPIPPGLMGALRITHPLTFGLLGNKRR